MLRAGSCMGECVIARPGHSCAAQAGLQPSVGVCWVDGGLKRFLARCACFKKRLAVVYSLAGQSFARRD